MTPFVLFTTLQAVLMRPAHWLSDATTSGTPAPTQAPGEGTR